MYTGFLQKELHPVGVKTRGTLSVGKEAALFSKLQIRTCGLKGTSQWLQGHLCGRVAPSRPMPLASSRLLCPHAHPQTCQHLPTSRQLLPHAISQLLPRGMIGSSHPHSVCPGSLSTGSYLGPMDMKTALTCWFSGSSQFPVLKN